MFRIFASILERKQPEGIHLSVGCLILIFSTVVSRCAIFLWQLGPVQSMVSFVMDCCLRLIWFYFSTWRNPTISAANIYIYMSIHLSLHVSSWLRSTTRVCGRPSTVCWQVQLLSWKKSRRGSPWTPAVNVDMPRTFQNKCLMSIEETSQNESLSCLLMSVRSVFKHWQISTLTAGVAGDWVWSHFSRGL